MDIAWDDAVFAEDGPRHRDATDQDGGSTREIETFGSNPGNLGMRLHVPAPGGRASRPLVVALHGCTQTAVGFGQHSGWQALADQHGFLLLLPEQRRQNNRKTCFSWFKPEDTRRGQGEVESISQMVATAVRDHGADPRRVFVTGLSAGGAMACALLATYPDLFAAGAVFAALPYGAATNVAAALDAMYIGRVHEPRIWGDAVRAAAPRPERWPSIAIWHGTADKVVKPINAGELVKQWTNVHGVTAQHPVEDQIGPATRRTWRDGADRACVIEYSLPGLAHGMPVAGETPPAAFFLAAGFSAAEQIADDFGLVPRRRPPSLLARLGLTD